jgi:ABC-type phosphate transport system substrate-binding protein
MASLRRIAIRVCLIASILMLQGAIFPAAGGGASSPQGRLRENSLAIVVNRSNPVEGVSVKELRKIFLGQRGQWPHGRRIAVVMMEPGQPERATMLREVFRMSEETYQDYLLKGLFTGDVFVSPKILASPAVVRKFILNAPGAIGYLRVDDVDNTVKVLKVDGRFPDDKEYALQLDARLSD